MKRTAACIVLAAVLLVPTAATAAQPLRTAPVSWWETLMIFVKVVTAPTEQRREQGVTRAEEEDGGESSFDSSITIDPNG